ncbi:hypothetical protein OCC_14045 [Thermococcus litoralis DSM 5473]|uniref:Uncharacterized protein n=1 Tax=Thermococcus litoralis (strain ATCC 51850 / DSM 5473 / JCM 8560 / NS-C) TaxID=523849 RepID=S5ZIE8_THELN|nr:hypothetical protein [Thermococcus litoralis]AGT34291.1 hypothetical protein OCC_14045 [Thermococcus litoralis DSM 5473]
MHIVRSTSRDSGKCKLLRSTGGKKLDEYCIYGELVKIAVKMLGITE